MKVIDDFLPSYQFKELQSILLSEEFPWYFNSGIVAPDDGQCQLTHMIFNIRLGGIRSNFYHLFNVAQRNLGVGRLDRIKLNLNPKTVFHRKGGYHSDNSPGDPDQHKKTAVFYINTNNGWTHIKKGGKVKRVENRIVIFDSDLYHTGVTCTDEMRRVIVNFNYD